MAANSESRSGRYQSKVFSFFSQQSLRWRDKAQQTWRQAKTAALWGVQILLYPIYLTFQATQLVGKQLHQATQRVVPQLQAPKRSLPSASPASSPVADTPLNQTLQTVNTFALASLPPIQGIVSLLPSRHLALVTTDNQVLDLLTSEQQTQLQRQIIWNVANYRRQQQLQGKSSATAQLAFPKRFLSLPAISDRPNAWLPIRVFYRLMAWMQASPVALATNLFQEAYLPPEAIERQYSLSLLPAFSTREHLPAASSLKSAELSWSSWGEIWRKFFPASPSASAPPASPAPLTSPASPQPWLTASDLFGQLSPVPRSAQISQLQPPTPEVQSASPAVAVSSHRNARSLTMSSPASPASPASLVSPASPAATGVIPTTIDIEAEVRLVTYVKHPLEQVLEWLDLGMLWLEERVSKTLNWVRDRFR